nr:hypothetical protein [Tanacetum cinerariifolium]
MTDKYFVKYTGIEYDIRVNKRQMQQECKVDTDEALEANLVVIKSSRTKSELQDESSKSWNDTDAVDADIRPIYNKEPMVEPRTTTSTEVPTANMIVMMSMTELESLFDPMFDEYFNEENQVVLISSAVTTTDASDKRQQQPDSASSTSTLATTITADENFDLVDGGCVLAGMVSGGVGKKQEKWGVSFGGKKGKQCLAQ